LTLLAIAGNVAQMKASKMKKTPHKTVTIRLCPCIADSISEERKRCNTTQEVVVSAAIWYFLELTKDERTRKMADGRPWEEAK
jgi:hypothetical protein